MINVVAFLACWSGWNDVPIRGLDLDLDLELWPGLELDLELELKLERS